MAKCELLIRSGTLVDGTGAARRAADLAVNDGVISQIGDLSNWQAKKVIDATGLIVAPGVIDAHTHYDAPVHWDPHCTNSALHGTTSVVVGNCGFGFAPCRSENRDRYMKMMETTEQVPLAAMRSGIPWQWESFPEWIDYMRSAPMGINMASYLPLNSLMIFVMGVEAAKSRRATEAEMTEMKRLLNEAMDHGAIGFALSHLDVMNSHVDADGTPMPTDTMFIEDAYELATVLAERGEGSIQCLCDLPAGIDNRKVAEELARVSGRPVLHNVIVAFDMMPDMHVDRLQWLDEVRARGLDIYSQTLCFRAWNQFNADDYNAWNSTAIFREFSTQPDIDAKLALIKDDDYRRRLREAYKPEDMFAAGGPIETYRLVDACEHPVYRQYEGKLMAEVAEAMGVHITDAFMEINSATRLQADFVTDNATTVDPDKVYEMLSNPAVLAGTSDGGAHIKFFTGGQFSTDMIMWMVREEQRFTLEQMHRKLSALPASVLGMDDRGTLEIGKAADVMIYDLENLGYERGRYSKVNDLPDGTWRRECEPTGIHNIIVNGQVIIENNRKTGHLPGVILASKAAAE